MSWLFAVLFKDPHNFHRGHNLVLANVFECFFEHSLSFTIVYSIAQVGQRLDDQVDVDRLFVLIR